MNKVKFTNYFKDKDNCRIEFLFGRLNLAENTGKDIAIDEFLTNDVYASLSMATKAVNLQLLTWEFYKDCEKKFCIISSHIDIVEFPIGIIKIENKSKFEQLEHKDYLGAIMSLDVKREKIGDLVVKDNCCYMPVTNNLIPYIITNLNKIKNCPCDICKIDANDFVLPAPEFKEIYIIVSSMRIDCILAGISDKSRAKSLEYLKSGKILINYLTESRKDRLLLVGDIITIRGIGKFKIVDILSKTQKGRLKLLVNKFL